jgi:hypothetical protein
MMGGQRCHVLERLVSGSVPARRVVRWAEMARRL